MASKKYNYSTNQFPDGQIMFISGKVVFSRLTSHYEGDELAEANRQRRANGMSDIDKPFTTITIRDVRINDGQSQEVCGFLQERAFVSRKYPNRGYQYNVDNKSRILPRIAVRDSVDTPHVREIIPEGELDSDLDVTLVLRIFPTRNANKGLSLDSVIVNEPVRYYQKNTLASHMKDAGLVWTTSPEVDQYYRNASTQNDNQMANNNYGGQQQFQQSQQLQQPYGQPQQTMNNPMNQQQGNMPMNEPQNVGNQYMNNQSYQQQNQGQDYSQPQQPQNNESDFEVYGGSESQGFNPLTSQPQPQSPQPNRPGIVL